MFESEEIRKEYDTTSKCHRSEEEEKIKPCMTSFVLTELLHFFFFFRYTSQCVLLALFVHVHFLLQIRHTEEKMEFIVPAT